jgi:hypothetical protein
LVKAKAVKPVVEEKKGLNGANHLYVLLEFYKDNTAGLIAELKEYSIKDMSRLVDLIIGKNRTKQVYEIAKGLGYNLNPEEIERIERNIRFKQKADVERSA